MNFKAKKIKEENKVLEGVKQTTKTIVAKSKTASQQLGVMARKIPMPQAFLRYAASFLGIVFVLFIAFQGYGFIRNLNFDFSISNIVNNLFGEDLKTDRFGRTNVLLMAVGGGQHDGPNLTDSILIASYDHEKKTVSLISIPRDLYVQITTGYYERVNAVYDYFNRKFGQAEGIIQMKTLMQRLTGLEMQYYVKINFQGFREVVDILGGIEVNVPERLVDEQYPVEDARGVFLRNELFVVEEGLQHMDGETALRYARSRHSTSDFDRSRRQHMVITAIRDKALKENYLSNPNAIKRLYYAIIANLEMDVSINEAIRGAFILKDIDKGRMISAGLNDDTTKLGGFLYTPDRALTNGAAVLIPNGSTVGNMEYYTDIRRFVDMVTSSQEVYLEKANILISNGTKVSGLGRTLEDKLTRFGFNVVEIGNTPNKEVFEQSRIILHTPGRFQATLENLQTFILGTVVTSDASGTVLNGNSNGLVPDIEIVIGKDYTQYLD